MQGWLLDAWRTGDELSLWIKTPSGDTKTTVQYRVHIHIQACESAKQALDRRKLSYVENTRTLYDGKTIRIYTVSVPRLDNYERFVQGLEQDTRHRVPLYDADVPPEQRFFHEHDLYPGCWVRTDTITRAGSDLPSLSEMRMHLQADGDPRTDAKITAIHVDDEQLTGTERQLIRRFSELLTRRDPDVISCQEAFAFIPLLAKRAEHHGISLRLHRFDPIPVRYRGGSSFYSYGLVKFRDYGVRLRGRFLVDTLSIVGQECDAEAIFALCKLSGGRFQQLASRSAGSVFQKSLVRALIRDHQLIPYKQKPVPKPITLSQLVKQDRAGLVLDAKVGVHADVAEIDFVSMFPFLMWKKNISPEKIGSGEKAPGVDVQVKQDGKGYIARSLKPFIDLRMHYKQHPSTLNRQRAKGLKGVLVSANGYLRFREFKLGLPTTHVALCAWVRDCFLNAMRIAEAHGFTVLHGLVDSLYIQKPGITEDDVRAVVADIERATGIPMELEGIFKWILFLPSINDPHRPVATRYYGAFRSGGFKVRGIQSRQAGQPPFLRAFQDAVITHLCRFSADDLERGLDAVYASARTLLRTLHTLPGQKLSHRVVISKTEYDRNIPQRRIVEALRKQGSIIRPGMRIRYVMSSRGPVLAQQYTGNPDMGHYRASVERALLGMLQPLGVTRDEVRMQLSENRQLRLDTFTLSDPLEILPMVTGHLQTQTI